MASWMLQCVGFASVWLLDASGLTDLYQLYCELLDSVRPYR
jgi:hypothetical protein